MALRNISNTRKATTNIDTAIEQRRRALHAALDTDCGVSGFAVRRRFSEQHENMDDSFTSISSRSDYYESAAVPKIRTSSPISSSESSDDPRQSYRHQYHSIPSTVAPDFHSIRSLAYQKLRELETQREIATKTTSELRSNGKLKIAAYNNFGHLTVHVMRGRNYRVSSKLLNLPGETFVRVQLLDKQESLYNSREMGTVTARQPFLAHSTVNYDEKFSLGISHEDYAKRVVVSVWHRQLCATPNSLIFSSSSSLSSSSSAASTTQSPLLSSGDQLLGCFSFRVRSLMSNTADSSSQTAWFHLLPADVGSLKHLRYQQRAKQTKNKDSTASAEITNVNKDILGMQRMSYVIKRPLAQTSASDSQTRGYGFTVSGASRPCLVAKVEPNGAAFLAGLRPGDYISTVNGTNVSRATCDSVVRLIRDSTSLHIEICREMPLLSMDLPQQQIVTAPVIVQPITYSHPQQVYVSRRLESVPEESAEESLISSAASTRSNNGVFRPIRHMDSSSSMDDCQQQQQHRHHQMNNEDEENYQVDVMRRAALKYCPATRRAQVASVMNLRALSLASNFDEKI